jgi:hypothetical protein
LALVNGVAVLATGGYSPPLAVPRLLHARATPSIILALGLVAAWLLMGPGGSIRARMRARRVALFFCVVMVAYLANGKTLSSGDTYAARILPLSLLREANFDLDEFPFLRFQDYPDGPEVPEWLRRGGNHWVSNYPIGAAVLAVPVYLPAALGGVDPQSPAIAESEKLAASLIVALAAVVMLLTLQRLTTFPLALLFATFFALGTSNLSVSSQALWQHGAGQLGVACALYCLVRGRSAGAGNGWIALAGLPLAFSVVARPPNVIMAAALGAYVLCRHVRRVPGFVGATLPVLGLHVWYNLVYFADPLRTQWSPGNPRLWRTPLAEGLAGTLFSPARGLFVYSPACVLSILGFARSWGRGGDGLIRALSLGTVATLLMYAKWSAWWGGNTYGPRLLVDLAPALTLGMVPMQDWLTRRRAARAVALALVLLSVAAHAIGALRFGGAWDMYHNRDPVPARYWRWTDNELVGPPLQLLDRVRLAAAGAKTSETAPRAVVATYRTSSPTSLVLGPDRPFELELEAVNSGDATWIAWDFPRGARVRLGWHWQHADGAPLDTEWPETTGFIPLLRNVRPGEAHRFRVILRTPPAEGNYRLEVCLFAPVTGRLVDGGSPPARLDVTVR